MGHWKARIFALIIIIVCAGLIYVNWLQLWRDGTFYLKLAAFAPVGVVGGIFLLLFPSRTGKPETTVDKVVVLLVLVLGLLAGAVNVFLMDPGMFGVKH